jgi:tRNA nucleotidyltransferase/poly(A) polymerase
MLAQVFLVGGAVRDALLKNQTESDRDYVVVGSTPEQMQSLGFVPVGKDFPVFVDPDTGEEYALARTERKVARGYHGFQFHTDPSVTLEQDLARRDLSINAMAYPLGALSDWAQSKASFNWTDFQFDPAQVHDPFSGLKDLQDKLLRHVGQAFTEDPVRILRLARFAARFASFVVAPETFRLVEHMVQSGEVDALVPERVWKEISRGLLEDNPKPMIRLLISTGTLSRLLPMLKTAQVNNELIFSAVSHLGQAAGGRLNELLIQEPIQKDLPEHRDDHLEAHQREHRLEQRFCVLLAWLCAGEQVPESLAGKINQHWKVPTTLAQSGLLWVREKNGLQALGRALRTANRSLTDTAAVSIEILNLLNRSDAFRKPERFTRIIELSHDRVLVDQLSNLLTRCLTVDSGSIAQTVAAQMELQTLDGNGKSSNGKQTDLKLNLGELIQSAIRAERLKQIQQALSA